MSRLNRIFGYLEESGHKPLRKDHARHERWVEAILPADAEAGPLESSTDSRPLWYFATAVVIGLAVLGLRLFDLQVVRGSHNLALADGNSTRTAVIHAPRGLIYDRNHVLLAQNLPSYDLTAIPQQLPLAGAARQREYAALGTLLGAPAAQIATKAEAPCQTGKRPGCLATSVAQLVIPNLSRTQALLFDQDSFQFTGFNLDINPVRQYDDNNDLSQVLGYTGRVTAADLAAHPTYGPTDYIGKAGIEAQYESLLRGTNGGQQTEVDASGHAVRVLAAQPPVPGDNLTLSIDFALQQRITSDLQAAMTADTAAHPTEGAAVAMNPQTGEILAMVSLPIYNHNELSQGINETDFVKLINDKAQPLFNKAISGVYPTGSIIKPLVASAALQEGTINTSTTINDIGYLSVPNENDPSAPPQLFHSYEPGGFGIVSLFKAMAVSSNVFFMSVGGGYDGAVGHVVGLGVQRLTRYYKLFGLGGKTGIDLPGESAGLVPTPAWKEQALSQPWYLGDTYNISVGQGNMEVSPLQMAVAISTIANGGKVMVPHVLDQVTDAEGHVIEQVKPQVARQGFLSSQVLSTVQQAMRGVVTDSYGTACCFIEQQVPVDVAAKTGTAENGSPEAHAWFEAYAPYEDPQLVIVALIANGGEGGYITAPAVRQTLVWYFTQDAQGKTEGPRNF